MFSSVSQAHSEEELEESFIVGTVATTPPLSAVRAVWPRPWVFFKVLLTLVVAAVLLAICVEYFQNEKAIPGLLVIGSFCVPLTVLLFYFEANVPRNVSVYQVFKMSLIGGTLALVIALFGFSTTHMDSVLGAPAAGVIEEIAKVGGLLFVVRNSRYRWTLNGLLLGGAVGAGFAGFESAGYAFNSLLQDGGSVGAMISSIVLRAALVPGGHVAWAALNGAALWRVKGDQPFEWSMLRDGRFVRVFVFTMLLHGIWDFTLPLPWLTQYMALMLVGIVGVLAFIQDGVKQVQRLQLQAGLAVGDAA